MKTKKRNTIHNIVMPRLPLWISKVMKRSNPWKDCVDYKHRLRSNRQKTRMSLDHGLVAILKTRNKPLKISARHWKKLRMRASLMSEPQKEVLRNTIVSPLKKSRRTTMKTKRS